MRQSGSVSETNNRFSEEQDNCIVLDVFCLIFKTFYLIYDLLS